MRDEPLLLNDILVALDRIDSYTKGMTNEPFIADEKTANAVVSTIKNQRTSLIKGDP